MIISSLSAALTFLLPVVFVSEIFLMLSGLGGKSFLPSILPFEQFIKNTDKTSSNNNLLFILVIILQKYELLMINKTKKFIKTSNFNFKTLFRDLNILK